MNVRLTAQQIEGIVTAIGSFVEEGAARLYLYGSRTRMDAKGGDIDLVLMFSSKQMKESALEIKHKLLAAIKNAIGDQKIDLYFALDSELKTDVFLKAIFPNTVLLHQF